MTAEKTARKIVRIFAAGIFIAAMNLAAASEPTKESVAALIAEAEAVRQRAAEAEFEWRFTGKYIKEAKEKLAADDIKGAHALASRAKREGELAVEQSETASRVWSLAVPR